jgi:hypothetical protein
MPGFDGRMKITIIIMCNIKGTTFPSEGFRTTKSSNLRDINQTRVIQKRSITEKHVKIDKNDTIKSVEMPREGLIRATSVLASRIRKSPLEGPLTPYSEG